MFSPTSGFKSTLQRSTKLNATEACKAYFHVIHSKSTPPELQPLEALEALMTAQVLHFWA
jgi:hypothetical protein